VEERSVWGRVVVLWLESEAPLVSAASGRAAASPAVSVWSAFDSAATSESVAGACAGVVGREKGGRDICVGVSGCAGVVAEELACGSA